MEQALEQYKESAPLTVVEMKQNVKIIHDMLKEVMIQDVHYGVIPGTKKPSLYKPGAEIIGLTFRLSPTYEIQRIDDPQTGHRENIVTCTLTHIPSGKIFGQGVGSCTTREGKYKYRTGEVELTDKPVPKEYWNDRDIKLIGGKGHTTKKDPDTGKWMIAIAGDKVEHDNPADYYNTVLKMAKKRAHIDATLTVTGASDMFTQDVEDMPEVIPGAKGFKEKEEQKPAKKAKKITKQMQEDLFQLVLDHDWPESAIRSLIASYGFDNSKDITVDKYEAILKEIEKGYQKTIDSPQ